MKNQIPFSTTKEINKNINHRQIVFFGDGNIAEKTNRIFLNSNKAFIVDNSSNLWGDKQFNLSVKKPNNINNNKKKYFYYLF